MNQKDAIKRSLTYLDQIKAFQNPLPNEWRDFWHIVGFGLALIAVPASLIVLAWSVLSLAF